MHGHGKDLKEFCSKAREAHDRWKLSHDHGKDSLDKLPEKQRHARPWESFSHDRWKSY